MARERGRRCGQRRTYRRATACSVKHLLWLRVRFFCSPDKEPLHLDHKSEWSGDLSCDPPPPPPHPPNSTPSNSGLNPAFLPDAPALKQSGPFPPLTLGNTMVCHGKTHRHLKSALEAGIYPPTHPHPPITHPQQPPQSRVQHLVAAVSPFWHKQGRKLQFNMQLSEGRSFICYRREADKCMGIGYALAYIFVVLLWWL